MPKLTEKQLKEYYESKEKRAKSASKRIGDLPVMLPASINNESFPLDFKEFKTGTLGYYGNGKIQLDGKKCQVAISVYIVHSKPGEENA